MLRGIPRIVSPDLMHVLLSMGHGDEIVLADGNFPAVTNARRLVRADGHGVPEVLRAIVRFFPLDTFVEDHAVVMATPPEEAEPEIWAEYRRILREGEGREVALTPIERFAFYERASRAFAVVATGETALYANLILKKGVVLPHECD
ncbi:MAG: fucose isomerase [Candidatus Poribacteria bacterium]|nr:MAG: fucose isomerase [Candidatus Poribacteria bacterium]